MATRWSTRLRFQSLVPFEPCLHGFRIMAAVLVMQRGRAYVQSRFYVIGLPCSHVSVWQGFRSVLPAVYVASAEGCMLQARHLCIECHGAWVLECSPGAEPDERQVRTDSHLAFCRAKAVMQLQGCTFDTLGRLQCPRITA
jgi:hypothetical protein